MSPTYSDLAQITKKRVKEYLEQRSKPGVDFPFFLLYKRVSTTRKIAFVVI